MLRDLKAQLSKKGEEDLKEEQTEVYNKDLCGDGK